jgi:hypothetical protein
MVTVDVRSDTGHGTNNKGNYINNVVEWYLTSGRAASGCNKV